MRVLIVKTTSLGDVIHTLPAVQDAYQAIPNIVFDWVVEAGFSQVPTWHPAVGTVIQSRMRAWRKAWFKRKSWAEFFAFKREIKARPYDLIIDAQGLIKSGWMSSWATGKKVGFSKACIKEPFATVFYDKTYDVDPKAHAIDRVRHLFAQALGYAVPAQLNYGLDFPRKASSLMSDPKVMLLHGTTWPTKHYPAAHWRELATLLDAQGIAVSCVWGTAIEHERAMTICAGLKKAKVLPKMSLTEVAHVINQASAVVAVDTGLAHLSAALGVPTLSLYGPTDPDRTGTRGDHQVHKRSDLPCAPCLKTSCSISDMRSPLDPPCMGGFLPQDVLGQVLTLLRTKS